VEEILALPCAVPCIRDVIRSKEAQKHHIFNSSIILYHDTVFKIQEEERRIASLNLLSKVCVLYPVLRDYALLQYLRAAVTHGKRGEHKPRNGDRIHTSVPVYLLMVLQGHWKGVALLVVWHHSVRYSGLYIFLQNFGGSKTWGLLSFMWLLFTVYAYIIWLSHIHTFIPSKFKQTCQHRR
jgi:hypothetical protein